MDVFSILLIIAGVLACLFLVLCLALALSADQPHPVDQVRSYTRCIERDTLAEMQHLADELNDYIIDQTQHHTR